MSNNKKNPANMTFEEVFKESMAQLYDRVSQDVRFVGKIVSPLLSPILRSMLGAIKLAWRYAKSIFLEVVPEETRNRLEQSVSKFLPTQEWISEGGVFHAIFGRVQHFVRAHFEN